MTADLIHVALVSPLAALRAGWRAFLSVDSAIEIIAESTSLNLLEPTPGPMDVLIVTSDSADATRINQFTRHAPSTAILLMVTDEAHAVPPFLGLPEGLVFGLQPINLAAEDMLGTVHALYQGFIIGAPYLMKQVLGQNEPGKNDHPSRDIDALTQRETLVLQLLAQGLTNKQIAHNLNISEHTVKFHVQSIYSKMRVNNRAEVVRVGVTSGLIIV
jgi:DNA-binding NarL/FixJ family response regulator